MLKTYLYIPDDLEEEIKNTAKVQKKSRAEVMRQALSEGLNSIAKPKRGGAEALLKIAELGKKYKVKGPKDGSLKMDEYLWGRDWNKKGG